MSLFERIYNRLLILVLPTAFRRRHVKEIRALAAESLKGARGRGPLSVMRTQGKLITDLLVSGTKLSTDNRHDAPVMTWGYLYNELRFSMRRLVRRPAQTAAVVVVLALSMGTSGAILGLFDAVVLKQVGGLGNAERLVSFRQDDDRGYFSYPEYLNLRRHFESLHDLAACSEVEIQVSGAGTTRRVNGELVTANYFSTLEVSPRLGRFFDPAAAESTESAESHVVISEGLWNEWFAQSNSVLGRDIRLNGRPYQIIGVAPADFRGTNLSEVPRLWVPLLNVEHFRPSLASFALTHPGLNYLKLIGRLGAGVNPSVAQEQLDRVAEALDAEQPRSNWERDFALEPLVTGQISPRRRPGVLTFMSVVTGLGLVLLVVGWLNVTNIQLGSLLERHEEFGLRLALGGSRKHLMTQILLDNLLLATVAGVLGLSVSWAGFQILQVVELPAGISPDSVWGLRSLLVAVVVTLATGLACGIFASLRATSGAVRSTGQTVASGLGWSRALSGGQIALTVGVLVPTLWFGQSIRNLTNVDHGMRLGGVVLASVDPELQGYTSADRQVFFDRLLDGLEGQPAIDRVAWTDYTPFGAPSKSQPPRFEGQEEPFRGHLLQIEVSEDYFDVLGIPLVQGTLFETGPEAVAERQVVISQDLAELFWTGRSPLGAQVFPGGDEPPYRVVGVVGRSHQDSLRADAPPQLYWPWGRRPGSRMGTGASLVISSSLPSGEVLRILRDAVKELDPYLPVFGGETLESRWQHAMATERQLTWILGFATLMLGLLSFLGLYGTLARSVHMRTREIGVRMALGATPRSVLSRVLGEGLSLHLVALPVGILLSFWSHSWMQTYLYQVHPLQLNSALLVVAITLSVSVLAAALPAIRAVQTDPMKVLRCE